MYSVQRDGKARYGVNEYKRWVQTQWTVITSTSYSRKHTYSKKRLNGGDDSVVNFAGRERNQSFHQQLGYTLHSLDARDENKELALP